MFKKLLNVLMGDQHQKDLNRALPIVKEINAIFETLHDLSDDELRARIVEIKNELQEKLSVEDKYLEELQLQYQSSKVDKERENIGNQIDTQKKDMKEKTQEALDNILPEVFAIVKDTCRRLLGMKYMVRGHEVEWNMVPFDVQLIGGIALHEGNISEMATGEGKTLVATLPLFLNALTGRGTHLVTVNDYLAQRDSEWMNPIFEFHNIKVGRIVTAMNFDERKEAYACDITYGTNSEFGFDYLRDNMAVSIEQVVQRKLFYAIIDEADSVLIDEARTPLIISGPVAESKDFYKELKPILARLIALQEQLVQRYLSQAKAIINQTDTYTEEQSMELGRLLLLVKRAAPRNKGFAKIIKDGTFKKLVSDYEGVVLRDKKMHEVDADLYYSIEEVAHSADLCEKGREEISKHYSGLFIMESFDEELKKIEDNEELDWEEKAKQKEKVTDAFLDKNEKLHNISQLIKAYALFEKDVEYVVMDNKVMIVDEFTGRMMPGRRYSDGLHQAIEAKEGVHIEEATQTLATITLQNFFRMYDKIAGMTGTAVTEEAEFAEIYKLKVRSIPTNEPVSRIDFEDEIYLTKNDKYKAIISEIEYWNKHGKPVLVGTVSVEVSEILSRMLRSKGINHSVLNAKHHEKEAEIVMDAGKANAVTIATNMAGRGTDIKLGENVITKDKKEYLDTKKKLSDDFPYGEMIDGLHVIGTERHESRRIDRQLRGRAGRQGDPGTSRFFLSLEDDLMRLFGSDRIAPMMLKMGMQSGEKIIHPWMTKAVEKAQTRVEAHNFEIRKQLIKYDEVMNQQREVIYNYRRNVLKGYDLKNEITEMISTAIENMIEEVIKDEKYAEDWNYDRITSWLQHNYQLPIKTEDYVTERMDPEILFLNIQELVLDYYEKREIALGEEILRKIERHCLLEVVDSQWQDHLHEMDILKDGIGLRAYGNKDPLLEYKKESLILFQELINRIFEMTATKVFTTYIVTEQNSQALERLLNAAVLTHNEVSAFKGQKPERRETNEDDDGERVKLQPRHVDLKIGRNDPCPCGSGKKYKKCCGKVENEIMDN